MSRSETENCTHLIAENKLLRQMNDELRTTLKATNAQLEDLTKTLTEVSEMLDGLPELNDRSG